MLKSLGYESESVSDGAQVLTSYTRARDSGTPFDLVIMDMTIPGGMGGKETIEKLIALDPDVRALVSSGYSAASDFASYGFRGVLAKPYRLQDLSAAVSKAIARH
jgi:CheY-like chemotaxis protein